MEGLLQEVLEDFGMVETARLESCQLSSMCVGFFHTAAKRFPGFLEGYCMTLACLSDLPRIRSFANVVPLHGSILSGITTIRGRSSMRRALKIGQIKSLSLHGQNLLFLS
jgi:hypothetical protein